MSIAVRLPVSTGGDLPHQNTVWFCVCCHAALFLLFTLGQGLPQKVNKKQYCVAHELMTSSPTPPFDPQC